MIPVNIPSSNNSIKPQCPRAEHPAPQWQRPAWQSLNGEWAYREDPGDCGEAAGWLHESFEETICVPFCRESELSGIGREEPTLAVWYHRKVSVPSGPEWSGKRIFLHFGAADYKTTVWVNGQRIGEHIGGHTGFSFDISSALSGNTAETKGGETEVSFEIVIRCRDDWRETKPKGKQALELQPHGCFYWRTTGIWQTVWLEARSHDYLLRPFIKPSLNPSHLGFDIDLSAKVTCSGLQASVEITLPDGGSREYRADIQGTLPVRLCIPVDPDVSRPWTLEDPYLYDLVFTLETKEGEVIDRVSSYAGLRTVDVTTNGFELNGKPVFQKLVLDQGYYPGGIMTAPDDDTLERDIVLARDAGFNGARYHQKVVEERLLYHADRLGFLVWGEFADWGHNPPGTYYRESQFGPRLLVEWLEAVERDRNHPCIIGWCPLNEVSPYSPAQRSHIREIVEACYQATRLADPTRPVIDASGWSHCVSDIPIYDIHDYDQDGESLSRKLAQIKESGTYPVRVDFEGKSMNIPYEGQPLFVSEFGGARYIPSQPIISGSTDDGRKAKGESWGYGSALETESSFIERFARLCEACAEHEHVCGYCYTQLTDIGTELNGILTFDRQPKVPLEKLKTAQDCLRPPE